MINKEDMEYIEISLRLIHDYIEKEAPYIVQELGNGNSPIYLYNNKTGLVLKLFAYNLNRDVDTNE